MLFPIIITLIVSIASTLIIGAIFGAIIVWRRKRLRNNQTINNNENYCDINSEYDINKYESVYNEYHRYETPNDDRVSYDVIGGVSIDTNNVYTEILP